MKGWHLSGPRARQAMSNFFRREEVHSEASHLEDYVDNHPFLSDHPRPSMSAAIKRDARKFRVVGFSDPRKMVAGGRKVARKKQTKQLRREEEKKV